MRLATWLWFRHQGIHIGDELDYNRLAINLVTGGELALEPGRPTSQRPPLYPAMVAGVYRLCGLETFQAVRLVQIALSLGTVALLHRLAAAVFGRRVALWAAGAVALYPSLLGFDHLLLTETLFTCLLCAACYLSIRAVQDGSLGRVILAGSVLGLAALTRSAMWPFAIVLSVFLACRWPGPPGRRAVAGALLAAAFTATIAPWVVRNVGLERAFVVIDTSGGRAMMMGNYRFTPLTRPWDAVALPPEQSWHAELAAARPIPAGATRGQIDALAFREGLRFIREHPGLTVVRDVVKLVRFWGLERELIAGAARGYFGPLPVPAILLLALLILGCYASGVVTGVFGVVMAPPADRRAHQILLLAIGHLTLVHTVTFGHSRYHLPLMPLVLLYSASACVDARALWARRRSRTFRWAAGLGVLLGLGWLWEVGVDAERSWAQLTHR